MIWVQGIPWTLEQIQCNIWYGLKEFVDLVHNTMILLINSLAVFIRLSRALVSCMPCHGSLSRAPAPILAPSRPAIAVTILMNGPNLAYIVSCTLFYMSNLITEIGICVCRCFEFSCGCRAWCRGMVLTLLISLWGDQLYPWSCSMIIYKSRQ